MKNRECVNCGASNEIYEERCKICGRLVVKEEEPDSRFSMKCRRCWKIISVRHNTCPYCGKNPRDAGIKELAMGIGFKGGTVRAVEIMDEPLYKEQ